MLRPPVFTRGGKRVVVGSQVALKRPAAGVQVGYNHGCFTFVSDDDGKTWQRSNIVTVPDHKGGGFHKGIRWNHGAVEPTVVELKDGRLWMIIRTAQDKHYQAFSEDGGLTWSESTPSPFYGTITMPTMGRLSDGRLLFFWCNTTPLPEMATANGVWDDVFTNRDVTHIAISEDDGKTWKGFRELYMNPLRNASDYASLGDAGNGIDRSVQQAQFVEVAPGKILAAIGQNPLVRAMVLFDVDWLYENARFNDFTDSLSQWTTFNYIKGIKGHCLYNRLDGVALEVHPDKAGKNVLHLQYKPDETLVADTRGAVWNFPAMQKGTFTTSIRIPQGSENVALMLNDRWFNPSDTVARHQCMFDLALDRKKLGIKDDRWHEVSLSWDLTKKNPVAIIRVDGKKRSLRLPLKDASRHGISYAHFQAAPAKDNPGIYVEWVKAEGQE